MIEVIGVVSHLFLFGWCRLIRAHQQIIFREVSPLSVSQRKRTDQQQRLEMTRIGNKVLFLVVGAPQINIRLLKLMFNSLAHAAFE